MLLLQPGHRRFANPDVYTSAKEKKSSRLYFRQLELDGVSTTGSQPDGDLSKRDRGFPAALSRNCSEVNSVQRRVEDLPHSFETIQIIDKNVGIDDERAWTTSHLVVPIDIFQKVGGAALVLVSQFVDVGKAWETGFSPHAESSLVRRCGLGKKVIDHGLGDALLIADTNCWNVSLTNKYTHAVA